MRRQVGNALTLEPHFALARPEKGSDELEERRLAGAVGPDHRQDLAFSDREGHAIHGDKTAEALAEIGDFSRFRNGKQLSRYCGLAPVNDSSGERDRQLGIGKACNGDLRRLLVETSHRLSRYVPRWRQMKAHLLKRGKKRSVATIAVANRWLRGLHYEMTRPLECGEVAA